MHKLFIRHGFQASDLQKETQIGGYVRAALQETEIKDEWSLLQQEIVWMDALRQVSRPFRIGGETLVDPPVSDHVRWIKTF